jgi:predicted nucleic acid-binding protein
VILADTSIWVGHFRKPDAALYQQLQRHNICIHPFIVTELALGNLPDRQNTIASLDWLPAVKVAQLREVRQMVEAHSLFARGIGLVDVHLLASTLLTAHTVLWSHDKRLRAIAETFGINAFPSATP